MFTVTFYSYKGGVGRTMALANTAYRLSAKGKRVFILDFDLEAPGLDAFFPDAVSHPGIVEFVTAYLEQGKVPPLEEYVHELPPKTEFATRGPIYCMRAGRGDEAYQELLARLNWKDFYGHNNGFLFVENLKGAIQSAYSPDYILVDSRTGLTDVSGICTLQLPNLVVFFFALNKQNLEGIATIYRSVAHNKLSRPIETLLVASPVPDLPDYVGLKEERLAAAKKCLGRDVNLMLPYTPFAAFEERVLPPKSGTHLALAYDTLVDSILDLNKFDVLTLLKEVRQLRREGDPERTDAKYRQLIEGFPQSPEVWQSFGTFLRSSRKPKEASLAFRNAIEYGGGINNYAELALALLMTGDTQTAEDNFYRFLSRSSNADHIWHYSELFEARGREEPATAGYTRVLELFKGVRRAVPLNHLGNIHMRNKRPQKAIEFYEKGAALYPNDLALTYNLAYASYLVGREMEARQHFEHAAQIYEQLQGVASLPTSRANTMQAMGQAYLAMGDMEKAEQNFRDALQTSETVSSSIFSAVQYKEITPEQFRQETRRLLKQAEELKDVTAKTS